MAEPNTLPAGHTHRDGLWDRQGRFVPTDLIKPIDLMRHELVLEIVEKARAANAAMRTAKHSMTSDIDAFEDVSFERYGVKPGGKKGNLTLYSHDGRYKVQRAIADRLTFDERLGAAKKLVDECIHEWTEGAADEIRVLVDHAFQVDKAGKISTERVLNLRRMNIEKPKWRDAMRAIADSIQVASSKSYLRVYERIGTSDEYVPIALDFASI